MKTKFPNIYEFLNRPYADHQIDDLVYDTAQKLLDYFRNNKFFQSYNYSMNSDSDVRIMFDELVNWWIDEHHFNIFGECKDVVLVERVVLALTGDVEIMFINPPVHEFVEHNPDVRVRVHTVIITLEDLIVPEIIKQFLSSVVD